MDEEKEKIFSNKFTLGLNPEGKPPVYNNEDDFFDAVSNYFTHIDDNEEKPTVTGLALFLGFESRQSIYDYAKKSEYSYIIKRAQLIIQNWYEINLTDRNVTGIIFALKNMGWSDKFELDNRSSDGSMSPNKNIDLSKLSDKELILYKKLQEKLESE